MQKRLNVFEKRAFEKAKKAGKHQLRTWIKEKFGAALIYEDGKECCFKAENGVYNEFYCINLERGTYAIKHEYTKFLEKHEIALQKVLESENGYIDERKVRQTLFNIYHDPVESIRITSGGNVLTFKQGEQKIRFNVESGIIS